MLEFLQSYGVWIVLGLVFLFMMRAHGHGGGCGMGGHQHSRHGENEEIPAEAPDTADKGHGRGCH